MPKLICIDPGHGPETPGKRTPPMPDGKQIQEYQFNVPMGRFLESVLKRCGFKALLTANGTSDVPLSQRVKIANDAKADAFISTHFNAFRGIWDESEGGVETHFYPGSVNGGKLADAVQGEIAQDSPNQINRGVKQSDFHVLRETVMPAILVENGFMDVRKEAELMLNPEFQKRRAEQIAKGVCKYFNVPYIHETQPAKVTGTAIIGPASATVRQAQAWAKKRGAAQTFIDIAPIFWRLAQEHGGVNPAIAYAQSAKETGFGKFGGVLDESYHNPCGLKIKQGGGNNDPAAHKRFVSWDEGIAAHLDHLALYAGAAGYPRSNTPDPRHFSYIKGKASTVEALGGAWAPSKDYGVSIINNYLKDLQSTPEPVQPPPTQPNIQPITIKIQAAGKKVRWAEDEQTLYIE